MKNGTVEMEYLIGDLLPMVLIFVTGIVILPILVTVVVFQKHCVGAGNTLIVWLYGGHLSRVEEGHLYIDNEKVDEITNSTLRIVRAFLLANAITLLTLLVMIFWDNFFVRSHFDLGCLENFDCYIADQYDYDKPPLNCSQYFNQDTDIICYQYALDFFRSFADTGGILAVATLAVWLMTKLVIYCRQKLCSHSCVMYTSKTVFSTIFIVIVLGVIAVTHTNKPHRERYTYLRYVGYSLKIAAVWISFIITTLTPWFLLVKHQSNTCSSCICCKRTHTKSNINVQDPNDKTPLSPKKSGAEP